MTNREWVNTLTNEEFVDWCCEEDGIDYNTGKTIGIYPHLKTIKLSYTDSKGGLLKWLNEERLDYNYIINN